MIQTQITWPLGAVNTLAPTISFIAEPHEAFQVRIVRGGEIVWESDTVSSAEYSTDCPALPSGSGFTAEVRVCVRGAWQGWVKGGEFSVPQSPTITLIKPAHAGRMIGPHVDLMFDVEADMALDSVTVSVDGLVIDSERRVGRQAVKARLDEGLHTFLVSVAAQGRQIEARAEFFVANTEQLSGDVFVLDLTEINDWDIAEDIDLASRLYDLVHAAACLQGIVNRDSPRLIIRAFDADDEWLQYLREDGNWLETARFCNISTDYGPEAALLEAVSHFKHEISGLVEWDSNVAATSNVATTVAGVEDLLPVRKSGCLADSLRAMGLPVKCSLIGKFTGSGTIPDTNLASTGSAKCDAYLWAKERYLDAGRCNPRRLGYWLDAFWLSNPGRLSWWECCLTNHDWIVKHRGFLFDLSNWGDEAPQDDLEQPLGSDLATFKSIMASAASLAGDRMIHVSGFTPWAHKYTEVAKPVGKHHAVHTEWEVVRILSAYNAYLDADAIELSALVNASFWAHFPLSERYVQNTPPTYSDLQRRGYIDANGSLAPYGFVMFYIGDYDSAAWLYRREMELWNDSVRGKVPMGWAYNPNLSERFPVGMHYAFDKASGNDFFTAGDSGAGYVNPTQMLEPRSISGLPSSEEAWVQHCRKFYQRFNYRITGFLINGHAGLLTYASEQMTARFSPDGAATQPHWMQVDQHLTDNMPVCLQIGDLDWDEFQSAKYIATYRKPEQIQFLNFRTILRSPAFIQKVTNQAKKLCTEAPLAMLDPLSFFSLLRKHLGGDNPRRATFTFDTLPSFVKAGGMVDAVIGIRNDGWDGWKAEELFLRACLSSGEGSTVVSIPLPHDVEAGAGVVIRASFTAPQDIGSYDLDFGIADINASRQQGDIAAWTSVIKVH